MTKRAKFVASICSLVIALCAFAFGVFAATSITYSMSNSVSYLIKDALVKVSRIVEYVPSSQMNFTTTSSSVESDTQNKSWTQASIMSFQTYDQNTGVWKDPQVSGDVTYSNGVVNDNVHANFNLGFVYKVTIKISSVSSNGVKVNYSIPTTNKNNVFLKEGDSNLSNGQIVTSEKQIVYYLGLIDATIHIGTNVDLEKISLEIANNGEEVIEQQNKDYEYRYLVSTNGGLGLSDGRAIKIDDITNEEQLLSLFALPYSTSTLDIGEVISSCDIVTFDSEMVYIPYDIVMLLYNAMNEGVCSHNFIFFTQFYLMLSLGQNLDASTLSAIINADENIVVEYDGRIFSCMKDQPLYNMVVLTQMASEEQLSTVVSKYSTTSTTDELIFPIRLYDIILPTIPHSAFNLSYGMTSYLMYNIVTNGILWDYSIFSELYFVLKTAYDFGMGDDIKNMGIDFDFSTKSEKDFIYYCIVNPTITESMNEINATMLYQYGINTYEMTYYQMVNGNAYDISSIFPTLNIMSEMEAEDVILPAEAEIVDISNIYAKKYSLSGTSTKYQIIDDALYSKDGTKLISYPSKKEIDTFVVPLQVATIAVHAFTNNSITNIQIDKQIFVKNISSFMGLNKNIILDSSNYLSRFDIANFEGCTQNTIKMQYSETEGLFYQFDSNYNGYFVTGYSGNSETIIIPQIYQGQNVVGIRANAFANNTIIKNVDVPNTMKVIESYAFNGCTSMSMLDVKNANLSIYGESVFGDHTTNVAIFTQNSITANIINSARANSIIVDMNFNISGEISYIDSDYKDAGGQGSLDINLSIGKVSFDLSVGFYKGEISNKSNGYMIVFSDESQVDINFSSTITAAPSLIPIGTLVGIPRIETIKESINIYADNIGTIYENSQEHYCDTEAETIFSTQSESKTVNTGDILYLDISYIIVEKCLW